MSSLFDDFRYVPSVARSLPLAYVRSVDLNKYKALPPNLDEIKMLTSSLADCGFSSLAPSADTLQVLGAMQLVVQFTLYSQRIMRDRLNMSHQQAGSDRVTSGLIASLEARSREMSAVIEALQSEKRSLLLKVQQVEGEARSAEARCAAVERDLRQEKHLRLLASADIKPLAGAAPLSCHQIPPCCCSCQRRKCSRRSRGYSRRRRRRDSSSSSSFSEDSSRSGRRRQYSRREANIKSHYIDPTPNVPVACIYPGPAENSIPKVNSAGADQVLRDAIQRLEADNKLLRQSLELIQKEQEVCYRQVLRVANDRDAERSRGLERIMPHRDVISSGQSVSNTERPLPIQALAKTNSTRAIEGTTAYQSINSRAPEIDSEENRGATEERITSLTRQSSGPISRKPISGTPWTREPDPTPKESQRPAVVSSILGAVQSHTYSREMTPMEEYIALKQRSQAQRKDLETEEVTRNDPPRVQSSIIRGNNATNIAAPAREYQHLGARKLSEMKETPQRYDSLVQSDGEDSSTSKSTERNEDKYGSKMVISSIQRLPDSKPPTAVQSRRESVMDTDNAATRFLSNLSKPRNSNLSNIASSGSALKSVGPQSDLLQNSASRKNNSPTPSSKSESSSPTSSDSSYRPARRPARSPSSSSSSSSSSSRNSSRRDRKDDSNLVSPVKPHSESLAKLNSFQNVSGIDSSTSKVFPYETKRETSGVLDASATSSVARRPTSRLLQETQSELQRLLEEEAEEEARKAAMNKSQLD